MNPFAYKSSEELAAMWQIRALSVTKKNNDAKLFAILMRVFANEYTAVTATTWETLIYGLFGCDIPSPVLLGYARVELSGRVTSIVATRDGGSRREALFRTQHEYTFDLRRLADRMKLSDADRIAMFETMKKWIAEDRTIGVHGEKIAS